MIEINGYRVTMTKDDLDELNGEIELRENVVKALEAQLEEANNVIDNVRDVLDLTCNVTTIDFGLSIELDGAYDLSSDYKKKYGVRNESKY